MRRYFTIAASVLLVFALSGAGDAEAKRKRVAEGIIIGIGIAALVGAAAAAAQDSEDANVYAYRDSYDPRENAVAACLHRTNRVVRANGGEGVELRRVLRVARVGSGSWRVDLQARGYYDGDIDRVTVNCRVFRNQVTRFNMS